MISQIVNALTILRIFMGLIIFFLISFSNLYLLSFILFFVAGITDYLDGYLARKYNAVTQIGEILDPIADKILIIFLFFAISVHQASYFIAFIASLIISREIWVGALRDFSARRGNSGATKVTFLAKIKTTIQLFNISLYLLGFLLNNMLIILIADIFLLITLIITLYTGFIYSMNVLKN
jgi:CDP-diacylglycerol--glycerol-3-phosphate 3-phosphatidyltransferase